MGKRLVLLGICLLLLYRPMCGSDEEDMEREIALATLRKSDLFKQRTENRNKLIQANGIKGDVVDAVENALHWLARHQAANGSWDACDFSERCQKGDECPGDASADGSLGTTALALMAFLGHGVVPGCGHEYADSVERGLDYLVSKQKSSGCITLSEQNHQSIYGHCFAALALLEAGQMTGDKHWKNAAERAVDYLLDAQNDHPTEVGKKYGWRYTPRSGDNDTSVTGWVVYVLSVAGASGKEVPNEALSGALLWLDDITDPVYYRAGYQERGKGSAVPSEAADKYDAAETCTAIAVTSRVFMGGSPSSAKVRGGASLLLGNLPAWDASGRSVDYYYWHHGTLAMFQVGGDFWKKWSAQLVKALLEHQHQKKGECAYGSWDPVDKWGCRGGRVYATAINALTLETVYRCKKMRE